MAHAVLRDTRRWPNAHVTVFERKPRFGGRVKSVRTPTPHTTRTTTGDGWYEAGASRIGDTHRRVRQFATQLGCTEVVLPASYDQHHTLPPLHRTFRALHARFVAEHGEDALDSVTWHDVLTMTCANVAERDDLVGRWGFLSVLTEMNAADFWAHAMPQYLCQTYYTLDGGLQTLVDKAVAALRAPPFAARTTIRGSTRVLGLATVATKGGGLQKSGAHKSVRRVVLTVEADVTAAALPVAGAPVHRHAPTHETYDAVFLALPAEAVAELQGAPTQHAHLWSSVSRNRLLRVYVRHDANTNTKAATAARARSAKDRAPSSAGTRKRKRKQQGNQQGDQQGKQKGNGLPLAGPRQTSTRRAKSSAATGATGATAALCKVTAQTSALCRCTSTHAREWTQLAYCDHRNADHLYNVLRMPKGLDVLRGLAGTALGPTWATFADADVDVYYWKRGTHSWRPQLPSRDHYARTLHPDAKAPWFVVGSSFSHYQHWMEGAVETAQDAYRRWCRYAQEWWGTGTGPRKGKGKDKGRITSASPTDSPPSRVNLHKACAAEGKRWTMADVKANGWVALDGYAYDVSTMVHKHPGGAAVLRGVLGTDISDVYHRIGHSSAARAWVEEGCVGVVVVV